MQHGRCEQVGKLDFLVNPFSGVIIGCNLIGRTVQITISEGVRLHKFDDILRAHQLQGCFMRT
jgi:hypothetical protein